MTDSLDSEIQFPLKIADVISLEIRPITLPRIPYAEAIFASIGAKISSKLFDDVPFAISPDDTKLWIMRYFGGHPFRYQMLKEYEYDDRGLFSIQEQHFIGNRVGEDQQLKQFEVYRERIDKDEEGAVEESTDVADEDLENRQSSLPPLLLAFLSRAVVKTYYATSETTGIEGIYRIQNENNGPLLLSAKNAFRFVKALISIFLRDDEQEANDKDAFERQFNVYSNLFSALFGEQEKRSNFTLQHEVLEWKGRGEDDPESTVLDQDSKAGIKTKDLEKAIELFLAAHFEIFNRRLEQGLAGGGH